MHNLITQSTQLLVQQLLRPQVSSHSYYPDWVVTFQLGYFVKSVHFIRVFKKHHVYNCMASVIQTFRLSEETQSPYISVR